MIRRIAGFLVLALALGLLACSSDRTPVTGGALSAQLQPIANISLAEDFESYSLPLLLENVASPEWEVSLSRPDIVAIEIGADQRSLNISAIENAVGQVVVELQLNALGAELSQSFTVDVAAVDDPPQLSALQDINVYMGFLPIQLQLQGQDVDSVDLIYAFSHDNAELVDITIDAATGLLSLQSIEGEVGVSTITVQVSAEGQSSQQSFVLNVSTYQPAGTFFLDNEWPQNASLTRYYDYYVPANLGAAPAPLLLVLHGATQDNKDLMFVTGNYDSPTREWLEIADEEGLILAIPNGLTLAIAGAESATQGDLYWNDCNNDVITQSAAVDDVAFLMQVIDEMQANAALNVDAERIYVTGKSNGGNMSIRLARNHSDKLAAIGVVTSANAIDGDCDLEQPSTAISVAFMNGTEDTAVPFNGGFIQGVSLFGEVFSSEQSRDFWMQHNQTESVASVQTSYADRVLSDNSTVSSTLYSNGTQGAEVLYMVVTGGQHQFPSYKRASTQHNTANLGQQNNDVEGIREMWAFMRRQRRIQ